MIKKLLNCLKPKQKVCNTYVDFINIICNGGFNKDINMCLYEEKICVSFICNIYEDYFYIKFHEKEEILECRKYTTTHRIQPDEILKCITRLDLDNYCVPNKVIYEVRAYERNRKIDEILK